MLPKPRNFRGLEKLEAISKLQPNWNDNGAEPFTKSHIELCRNILAAIYPMPEIFPTACGAIQLEYERPNGAYLEIEVYENGDISLYCKNSLTNSLSAELRELIRKILKFPITKHVLVDLPTTKIYVIADNPSTSDVYSYASIYTDFARKNDSYSDFMVHGVDEIDERGFVYKITPDSWERRYSYPRDIERIKKEVRNFHTQNAKR